MVVVIDEMNNICMTLEKLYDSGVRLGAVVVYYSN